MNKKGFSVVEILIVIAIIGILATILIPNFNESRKNGYDAGVQGNLLNAQLQAEAFFEKYNSFEGLCDEDNEDGIFDFGKDVDGFKCIDSDLGWTATAPLRLDYPNIQEPHYCVDSKRSHLIRNDLGFEDNSEWNPSDACQ